MERQAIAGLADIFERPNKKSEETRKQEEEKDSLLKTIGEQKVEIDFLKKVQADIRLRSNLVESSFLRSASELAYNPCHGLCKSNTRN